MHQNTADNYGNRVDKIEKEEIMPSKLESTFKEKETRI